MSDALSGAGTGAGIGTAIMPGIGTAIGAGVGGLVGILGGNAKKKEAMRREALNQRLGSIDSAYSALVNTPSHKVQETDPGAGGLATGLSGALAGYQTAGNIQEANTRDSLNKAQLMRLQQGLKPVDSVPVAGASIWDMLKGH